MPPSALMGVLTSARQVATHAERLGIVVDVTPPRPAGNHLGAVLADAILQAGLNYNTVVRPRVERIQNNFPDADRISGVLSIIDRRMVSDFLLWKHDVKISRFTCLAVFLGNEGIDGTDDLSHWLMVSGHRERLLNLHGVGPKTFDYMCCLVGIDRIAVDRHVKTFANDAGVAVSGYDDLQAVVSFAADLLGVPRRDFDAWIWRQLARKPSEAVQGELFSSDCSDAA